MRFLTRRVIFGLALSLGFLGPSWGATVRVAEGRIELPTYALGEEDPNPPFPLVVGHRIYPYTMLDDLTDRREIKTYKTIFLENEFLRAIILPEMGGRLYSLYDKKNQREVFYRNNVVKYGLVALRGAWISGGIEFNFPDGHTVVTASPVATHFRQNPDGSATVLVGDMDWVTGMHWEVALTLRPGIARLEQQVTLFNCTPVTNLYWFWANAAVPATDDMRFIYPMREAYPHAPWPVYTYPIYEGVDYSWYKNIRQPTSLFGRQVHRHFFGAYYGNFDYGVVHVADFREVPGKKIWSWGVAGDGLIWTDLLTDQDGPYNEIQSGRYQTQLNYEFMPPRRVESWSEYWYPVRGLGGGFVEATSQLALNARFPPHVGPGEPVFEIALCPTVRVEGVKVRLKSGVRVVREFAPVSLDPLASVTFDVPNNDLQGDPKVPLDSNLSIEVESAGGQMLARWSTSSPVDGNPDFVPAAGAPEPQLKSTEKMTVEELFLRGVDEEKHGKEEAAAEIYQQVLARDSGYIPALLQQALEHYLSADFTGAEDRIARALSRNGIDPTIHYAAGVIYRASERWTLAQDAFWAAINFGGPPAPAFAQLGEIAIHRKNYVEAELLLRQALKYNPEDALALTDLAVALRLSGKPDEAAKVCDQALGIMPLLPFALVERWNTYSASGKVDASGAAPAEPWLEVLRFDGQNALEVAAWYIGLDDLESAAGVLGVGGDGSSPQRLSAPVEYYRAWIMRRLGRNDRADIVSAFAAKAPYEKVFPYRITDALVLDDALRHNPLDAHAQYFLGNFLFARGRYDDAARVWLQALGEGFDYSVLERNLGLYAWRVKKDLTGAAGFYEKAIQLAPTDYRLYPDLDEIYSQLGDKAKRARLFACAPAAVLERDTVRLRRALLLAEQRHYDDALEVLMAHRFKPWEGGEIVRQTFVLANLEKGKEQLRTGRFREAAEAFRRALEYPANLGVGKPAKPHDEEALFWLGEALQAAGDAEAARAASREAIGAGKERQGASAVFQALAMRRLGQSEEADKILNVLADAAAKEKATAYDFYVAGLVERFRKREEEARKDFRHALELNPFLWQARLEFTRPVFP